MRKIKKQLKQNFAKKIQKRKEVIKKEMLSKNLISLAYLKEIVDKALVLVESGKRQEGTRILECLDKKYINNPMVNFGFGTLALLDNNNDDAIDFFNKTLDILPEFVEAHYNLGVAHHRQLNMFEMITSYQKVLEFGKEKDLYLMNQVQDLLNSFDKNIQKSHGIGLDEHLRGCEVFHKAVEFMQSENWEAAITEFNNTLTITPNHAQSYGNLGICYSSIGKTQKAIEALDRAIEIDPNYELALENRKLIESKKEGEGLNIKLKMVDYYKDSVTKNK